jgi:acyl-coenzyme A thioesterase PaaI-like protein
VKPTDLAFSQALGIAAAPAGSEHLLELPFSPLVVNHVGTVHAAAQFALAEAASAACLQRDFPELGGKVFAVVRGVQVKYRRAAQSALRAYGKTDELTRQHLAHDLLTRTRTSATVEVELRDAQDQVTFSGKFDWFIARAAPPPDIPS